MDIEYMRGAIAAVYDGANWKLKCQYMPDAQVIAIYHNFKERGQFEKAKASKRREKNKPKYEQITIFDILKGVANESN